MRHLTLIFIIVLAGCPGPGKPPVEAPPPKETPPEGTPDVPDGPAVVPPARTSTKDLDRAISFSVDNKPMAEILRHINALTGLDMAVAPEVLKAQKAGRTYSLSARDLRLGTFLDWVARLMNCSYTESTAPDIWFVDENAWLREVRLEWRGYRPFLLSQEEDPDVLKGMVGEMQKGLRWARPEVGVREDPRNRRVMVNSTRQGHLRLGKLMQIFSERRFIEFERFKLEAWNTMTRFAGMRVLCPEEQMPVKELIKRIVLETGLNVGYDASVGGDTLVRVPLEVYAVSDVLDKIMATTAYTRLHQEDDNTVWLTHPNEPAFYRDRLVTWEALGVYVFRATSVAKRVRGDDIVAGIRRNIDRDSWRHPSAVLKYVRAFDLLVIVNRPETVENVLRYLRQVKRFGRLRTLDE